MEPVKTSIWKIAITSLLTVMAISDIHAQQGEKNVIFNKWHLDGYVVEGKKHAPSNKEREDYILFREDMTFASKSEGQDEKGTYILNSVSKKTFVLGIFRFIFSRKGLVFELNYLYLILSVIFL